MYQFVFVSITLQMWVCAYALHVGDKWWLTSGGISALRPLLFFVASAPTHSSHLCDRFSRSTHSLFCLQMATLIAAARLPLSLTHWPIAINERRKVFFCKNVLFIAAFSDLIFFSLSFSLTQLTGATPVNLRMTNGSNRSQFEPTWTNYSHSNHRKFRWLLAATFIWPCFALPCTPSKPFVAIQNVMSTLLGRFLFGSLCSIEHGRKAAATRFS